MRYLDMALHTDLYQLNMMYGYWQNGMQDKQTVFDLYFRKLPFGNGFAIFAGLERVIDYLQSLSFSEEDLQYLREACSYDEAFLEVLGKFRFTGNIYSVREGEIVFPNQPLMRIEARLFEAQLIETALLNFVNFQTLIATKSARIKRVVPNKALMEFGTRRAQEADAAIWGARATYIGGFDGTSNVRAGKLFGLPIMGTMSHAWIQTFGSELEAFRAYAKIYGNETVLLVDTYDTLRSGVPNAIIVAHEMQANGQKMKGIRIDSGDLAYLSIEARRMLDEANLEDVGIVGSNDLDEHTIAELEMQGAKFTSFGVGTQVIVAADTPSLGGVYKLVAKEDDKQMHPTIKISGNPEKVTTPGIKTVYRIINKTTGKAEADYVAGVDEDVANQQRIKLFDPVHTWLHKFAIDFEAQELLVPVFVEGKLIYELPSLAEIKEYNKKQFELFWPEYLRKTNPEAYPVDLSEKVWETKATLVKEGLR